MFFDNFRELCVKKGVSVKRAATEIGLSNSIGTKWKNHPDLVPNGKTLDAIAKYFDVTVSYLLTGETEKAPAVGEDLNSIPLVRFPIIGTIRAGYNGAAIEDYTGDFAYYPQSDIHADANQYMVLRVKGNSMFPKILDGDLLLVKRTTSVDSGKIAVVMYNGDEATVKKVHYVYGEDWLELTPLNAEYETKRIEGADLEKCRVLGEVIKLQRSL